MKKVAMVLAAGYCFGLLFGTTAFAADTKPGMGIDEIAQKTPPPIKSLFVIEAASSKLTHAKGKRYKLTIPAKDIKSVLVFSDRPNRIAFRLKPEKYSKMVHSGKSSFGVSPPNIALKFANIPTAIFEVIRASLSRGTMHYELESLLSEQEKFFSHTVIGSVTMFIDDSSTSASASLFPSTVSETKCACTPTCMGGMAGLRAGPYNGGPNCSYCSQDGCAEMLGGQADQWNTPACPE
jgi:hypothetical protein